MEEGTATKTAAEFEQVLGLLGSGINVSANAQELTISATTLSRNFEETVALVREVLTDPRWVEEDFERVKSAALTRIKGREANPNAIAAGAYNKLLYEAWHPYGRPAGGSVQTVSNLEMDDLKAAHSDLRVIRARARMHIVGDINPNRAENGLKDLVLSLIHI